MKFKQKLIAILILSLFYVNIITVLASPPVDQTSLEEPESTGQEETEDQLPEIEAEGAILISMDTGKILYEKNMDEQFFPASTTKILTALLAIEHGDMDDIITVSEEANLVHRDGTIAGLTLDEEISLEKLLYGLMLPSGNDAAYTIAVYIARRVTGDPDMPMHEAIDYFCDMMNERAKAAGAKNSHFRNPHGYHDENHYTTPYDIAMIAREAMEYELFRDIVSTPMYTMESWNEVDVNDPTKNATRHWRNTNLLIDDKNAKFYYPHATGIKTGYTSHAGQCLVSSATKDSLELIAVVFKSSRHGKWTDSTELFEYGFKNFVPYELVTKGEALASTNVLNHDSHDSGIVELIANEGYFEILKKSDIDKIEPRIIIQPTIEAPVRENQVIGQISYRIGDKLLFKTELVANRDIEKKAILNIKTGDNTTDKTESSIGSIKIRDRFITYGILVLFLAFLYFAFKRRQKRSRIF